MASEFIDEMMLFKMVDILRAGFGGTEKKLWDIFGF